MNTYYEILGTQPDASQLEIKKAYFKMIRQYSPETNPEQFQKIREAYEHLKNAENAPKGPVFPPYSEPFAHKMAEQMAQASKEGNLKLYRDTCEQAWKLFPKNIQFLYHLVIAQRGCGNTGKAVKNAEKLVEMEPENKWFHRELAISYMERGFTQKAYFACEKAYELGCRDMDFILIYASECYDYSEYSTLLQILMEIIRQDRKWSRDELPEVFETYLMLVKTCHEYQTEYFPEIIDSLASFLKQYRLYLSEYIMEICVIFSFIFVDYVGDTKVFQNLEETLIIMEKSAHSEEEKGLVRHFLREYYYSRLYNDARISDTMKRAYDAWYGIEGLHPVVLKFALLDTKLCMIEERQEILEQAEIIHDEYPDFYGKMKDFLEKLKSETNLAYLKESLQKSYRKIEPDCSGGFYYKKYPDEKPKENLVYDGVEFEPYVRSTKKIGRNDPCPCGSGKKYKQCCMNKA